MDLTEKQLKRQTLYTGRIITVYKDDVKLINNATTTREVVSHPGGVAVVALTPNDEVFLVRQFRYPYQKEILEIPAGKLEKDEEPFLAMKRELQEETGAIANTFTFLGEMYPSPGFSDEVLYLWACRITEMGKMNLDDDEFLEVQKIPLEEALNKVLNNEIKDAKTQVGLLRTKLLLDTNQL